MMDLPDFYEEGLIAAELVEEDKVDASYAHIGETLSGIVNGTYRTQVNPDVVEKAQNFLERLQHDEKVGGIDSPKYRALELMLFDRDVTWEEKKNFTERYRDRSIKHLGLAREHPNLAAAKEFIDDLVQSSGTIGRGAAIGAKYAIFGVPMLLSWLGKKAKGGVTAYQNLTGEERKHIYYAIEYCTKNLFIGTGKFIYHTIDAVVKGAILGGVFLPTGSRRAISAFFGEENISEDMASKYFFQGISGLFSAVVSVVFVGAAYESGDPSLSAQLIKYGLPVAWAASALYEVGRVAKSKIAANKERLTSYQALPRDARFSAPALPPVQARVGLDHDDEIPSYTDIDGQEESTYVDESAMNKRVVGDPK